jgi:hypothetical protein
MVFRIATMTTTRRTKVHVTIMRARETTGGTWRFRRWLFSVHAKYRPEKLDDVVKMLERYAPNQEGLFRELVNFVGP